VSTTPAKKAAPKKPAAKTPAVKPRTVAQADALTTPAAKASTPSTKPSVHAEPTVKGHAPQATPNKHSADGVRPPASVREDAVTAAGAPHDTTLPARPTSSRFADRFAPPRPPSRQMNPLAVDTPKQPAKADPKLANAWKSKAGKDLTEDEVLAMPESEYMNEKQLEFFRTRLQALKDGLLSNAGETTEHLREDTTIVPDPADRATIEEEHALELRTRDRERKLLKKISQSLARIDSGEYGFCDETGEPIGLGRLIARPTATLSLEAQQRRELKQKMFGD
jgi:DnaK suppressor protein